MVTACTARLCCRSREQQHCQDQRGTELYLRGQCQTHPSGYAELALWPYGASHGSAVYMRRRDDAQKQQTQQPEEGDPTAPGRPLLRLVHRAVR